MDERGYTILLQNLLNRAVDIEIAKGKPVSIPAVEKTLEDLKDLFRSQLVKYKGS